MDFWPHQIIMNSMGSSCPSTFSCLSAFSSSGFSTPVLFAQSDAVDLLDGDTYHSYTDIFDDRDHSTGFFRDSREILALPRLLEKRFPQGVQIFSYASSVGQEALSIVMALTEQLKDPTPYLPIQGRDISSEIIDWLEKGAEYSEFDRSIAPILKMGITCFNDFLNRHGEDASVFNEYDNFEKSEALRDGRTYSEKARTKLKTDYMKHIYTLTEKAKKQMVFKLSDLFKDSQSPFNEPCILFFRNVWFYYSEKEQMNLAENLFKNMKSGSLLALGKLDLGERSKIDEKLKRVGFESVLIDGNPSWFFEKP